uniref:Peptidase aspartic putative domain-containing protein n=1 Tax=Anopheles minimus TaxID=112268 RepID=A0A182VPU0_9DIPT
MLPKDLPTFSGDPAEWAMFYSSYENTTKLCGFSNWENMIRLQKALKGPALEAARSRLVMPEMVPSVIEALRSRFGQPRHVINCMMEKLRRMPAPRLARPESIIQFNEAVQGMVAHMVAAGQNAHLTNPTLLDELVNKLPIEQQYLWTHETRTVEEPDLVKFSTFLEELGKDAAKLVVMDCSSLRSGDKNAVQRGHLHAHSEGSKPTATGNFNHICTICNKGGHDVTKCIQFRAMTVKERWQRARSLSFIVPVVLYGQKSTVTTFAFLDEGSSLTLVDEELAKQLGAEGPREPLCIRWTGDTTRVEESSCRVALKVGPIESAKRYTLNSVRTVPKLNLPRQSFTRRGEWEHLKGLPIVEYNDVQPRLMIGLDNLHLAVPIKTREGQPGDPVGVKTRLGWCVY